MYSKVEAEITKGEGELSSLEGFKKEMQTDEMWENYAKDLVNNVVLSAEEKEGLEIVGDHNETLMRRGRVDAKSYFGEDGMFTKENLKSMSSEEIASIVKNLLIDGSKEERFYFATFLKSKLEENTDSSNEKYEVNEFGEIIRKNFIDDKEVA